MYNLNNIDTHRFARGSVYVTEIARTSAGLAAITSDQHLSLLDPTHLSSGPVSSWETTHGNISALRVLDGGMACTAGEDGTVAVWDLKIAGAGAKIAQFKGEFLAIGVI